MEELKSRHDKIAEERKQIIEELKKIKKSKIIRKYFELSSKNDELLYQQKKLIREIKTNEYKNCNHILIMTKYEPDYVEGRSERYYGCVKCGLNHEVLSKAHGMFGKEFLTFEEEIMYDYLQINSMGGIHIHKLYDLDIAKSIYNNIKASFPNIDDETACKYLEIALETYEKENKNKEKRLVL